MRRDKQVLERLKHWQKKLNTWQPRSEYFEAKSRFASEMRNHLPSLIEALETITKENPNGTQLTVHTEIKINGVWHHHGTPWIPRDYRLYSKIAPVRSDSKIDDSPVLVSEQSALPLDATLITQIGFHDDHCIKCYVMGLEKIKEFVQWFEYEAEPFKSEPFGLEGRFDFVYHNGWAGLPKTIIPGHRISDARFIFWFD